MQLDILEMDVEDAIREIMDGFNVIQPLPYIMAGIEIQTEVFGRNDFEQAAEDHRRAHQILSARPLIRAE